MYPKIKGICPRLISLEGITEKLKQFDADVVNHIMQEATWLSTNGYTMEAQKLLESAMELDPENKTVKSLLSGI